MKQIVEKPKKEARIPITREERAKHMLYNGGVTRLVEKVQNYKVQSASNPNKHYYVSVENQTKYRCECPDYIIRSDMNSEHKCKHILLVRLAEEYSLIQQETIKSDILLPEEGSNSEEPNNPKPYGDADYDF